LLYSCSPNEPLNEGDSIYLKIENINPNEAWISLKTNGISLPVQVILARNDSAVQTISMTTKDTLLHDTELKPNVTYQYQAFVQNYEIRSKAETVTTPNLSGNFFRKEIYKFAKLDYESVIYDVEIIDENDIWVAGEIHTPETDEHDDNWIWIENYNVAHWDGTEWKLMRVFSYNTSHNSKRVKHLEAVKSDDVLFSISSYWNGERIIKRSYYSLSLLTYVNSIWGIAYDNYFTVGKEGTIMLYKSGMWSIQKYEGQIYDFYDIDGISENEVFAAGGNSDEKNGVLVGKDADGFKIIKEGKREIDGNLFEPYFVGNLNSVWISKGGTIFFGGQYLYRNFKSYWGLVESLEGNSINSDSSSRKWSSVQKIRGNDDNDFVFIDEYNALLHFNGATWKQLGMDYDPQSSYCWQSVDMKGDVIVVVGQSERYKAVIMMLKR